MLPEHASTRMRPENVLAAAGFLLLPLVYHPGLGDAGLLPRRFLLCVLALGFLAIWLFAERSGNGVRKRTSLDLPAALYVLLNLTSLIWALNRFSALVQAAQLLVLFLLFLGFTALFKPEHLLNLARFSTLGGLLVSLIGIAQYLGVQLNIPSVGLPSGTFIFRNLAASYLVGNLPLGLLALVLDPSTRRKYLWAIACTAQALFLVYTRTRGAWIGFAGALFLGFVLLLFESSLRKMLGDLFRSTFRPLSLRLTVAACAIVLLLGSFVPSRTARNAIQQFDQHKPTAISAITSILTPNSDRGRLTMWRHTLHMIQDHPLLGVGLDNWEYVYPLYDQGKAGDKITWASEPVRPHNDFLWITSELGLVGLGIYLWLLIAAWKAGLNVLKTERPEVRLAALVFLVGLAALLGHSVFSFPKEEPASAALFWVHLSGLAILGKSSPPGTNRFAWTVPALGLLVCACSIYLTWKQTLFDHHYHAAQTYGEAGKWLPATRRMSLALQQGPFDHRARFLLARYLQRAGRSAEAETAYHLALEAHPNYAHTHHNLGGLYAARKKWPLAIASYKNALNLRPEYEGARIHLGNAYIRAGHLDSAAAEFAQLLRTHPELAEAYGSLGAVYLQQNKPNRAIKELRRAIQIRPDYPEAYNNLAYACEKSGRITEAVAAYDSLLLYWNGDAAYVETVRQHIQVLRTRLLPED